MNDLTHDPLESLKRKAVSTILVVMIVGGIMATILHYCDPNRHPISLVVPPLTCVVSLGLLVYISRHPQKTYQVTKVLFGLGSAIVIFPEYFFLIEVLRDPSLRLIDRLPPLSSGIFLLTTGAIVFFRPRSILRLALGLWLLTAAPVVIYLVFHLPELNTPRGQDWVMTLMPAMGINLTLIGFYARLQDVINQLYIERFRLKEASERDALTGTLNRGAGEMIVENLIDRRNEQLGIVLCDIDFFKRINDNYGHLMGDRVLQLVAQDCQTNLRKKDILIRWGGEEFLIVVTGDDQLALENLAERLRCAIANHAIPEVGQVTASFGVALLRSQETYRDLFERADEALYRAKNSGRNCVVAADP